MINREAIPAEMQELKRWVVARQGSKLPLRADSLKAASSSDPSTWTDFDQACETVESGRAGFLGFVFKEDSGIVGIDIDKGFDDDGFLSEISIDCMRALESFTEISRSGRGIHIYVKGKIPFGGRNNREGVEIYGTGRYFIVTAKKLIYADLVENQNGIDYVVDKYFKDAVRETETGTKSEAVYKPLWAGLSDDGRIPTRATVYPPIPQGARNISLTSLAGQLRSKGLNEKAIREELIRCNKEACKPPLPLWEIETIMGSIMRYKKNN